MIGRALRSQNWGQIDASSGRVKWPLLFALASAVCVLIGVWWCRVPSWGIEEKGALPILATTRIEFGPQGDLFVTSRKNSCIQLTRWRSGDGRVSSLVFDFDQEEVTPPYSGSLDSYLEEEVCFMVPEQAPVVAFSQDYSLIAWSDEETVKIGSAFAAEGGEDDLAVTRLTVPADHGVEQLEFIAPAVLAMMLRAAPDPSGRMELNLRDLRMQRQESAGSTFGKGWSIRDRSMHHLILTQEPAAKGYRVLWAESPRQGGTFHLQEIHLLDPGDSAESSFVRLSDDGCVAASSRSLAHAVVHCLGDRAPREFFSQVSSRMAAFVSGEELLVGGDYPGLRRLTEDSEPSSLPLPLPQHVEKIDYRDSMVAYDNGELVTVGQMTQELRWDSLKVALFSMAIGIVALFTSIISFNSRG